MGFDLRRCAEAAVQAALAEAFGRPEPKRGGQGNKRRARRRRAPFALLRATFGLARAMFRLVKVGLMAVGLVRTVQIALDADIRREVVEKLAERFPIDDLLEEIAVEVDAARSALANARTYDSEQAGSGPADDVDEAGGDVRSKARRRPPTRSRGDTNGQRGRKPPNRGTRAA